MTRLRSSPGLRTALERASVCGWHYIPDPPMSPRIPALSQRGTGSFSMDRASTGTSVAANGVTVTVPIGWPRFEWFDLDGDGVRETATLCCNDAAGPLARETIGWPVPTPPGGAETWVIDFVEQGAAAAGGVLAFCGASTGATPYRRIAAAGGVYVATFHNGSGSVTSAALTAPTVGQYARLWCRWFANGSVQLSQGIATVGVMGALTPGTLSGALTPVAAFSGGYWLQGPSGFNGANTRLIRGIAVPGILTADEALQRW